MWRGSWAALACAFAATATSHAARADDDAPATKAPAPVAPARLDMTLTTLALTAPLLLEGETFQIAPVYEQVRLSATHLKAPLLDDLQLHVSGWAMLNVGSVGGGGQRVAGDFAYAYAEGSALDRRVRARVGRQLVSGGVARLLSLDGFYVAATPTRRYGATAWGGLRVLPGFAATRSDPVYGARGYWRPRYGTEVGASWLLQYEVGRLARHDVGADARWQPSSELALQAATIWSLADARLVEGLLGADYRPMSEVQVWLGLRRTAPDLLLSRASIFSVFSQEQTDELGGEVTWSPGRRLRLRGDWAEVRTLVGEGRCAGARVSGQPLAGDPLLFGIDLRRLALTQRGYSQARLFGSRRVGTRLLFTGDFDAYFLDEKLNGRDFAFTAVVTAGTELREGLRVLVAALAGTTPLYAQRYEFTARLAWDLAYSGEAKQ